MGVGFEKVVVSAGQEAVGVARKVGVPKIALLVYAIAGREKSKALISSVHKRDVRLL